MRVALVTARYYEDVSRELEAGASLYLADQGARVDLIEVPGALEIPGAIARLADTLRYEGYVALGCVIRGETSHYDIVAGESARAIMDLTVTRKLAIGNGILTTENRDQALVRARLSQKNKGADAARACLSLMALGVRLD